MSILESLPWDILLAIGNTCAKSELNGLAKANRLCHIVFNRMLYDRNILHDPPHKSCVFFAIQTDNTATIRKALEYGVDVNMRALETPIPFLLGGPEGSEDESEDEDGEEHEEEDDEEQGDGSTEDGGEVMTMNAADAAAALTSMDWDMEPPGGRVNELSYNPLQCAAFFRRHEIVKYLLQHGADIDATALGGCKCFLDFEDVTALHIALGHGQGDEGNARAIAKTLIENGARESGHGYPAIFEIVDGAEVEIFDALADLPGVDLHATDVLGKNLLHLAVASRDGACLPLCQRLIERGVAVNQLDNSGSTPFSCMATCGEYVQASMLLLDHGADPTVQPLDRTGFSASVMMNACIFDIMDYPSGIPWESHSEFVKAQTERTKLAGMLLEKDNPPSSDDSQSRHRDMLSHFLFGAVAHLKDVHCMQMLLDAGARPDLVVARNFFDNGYPFMAAVVKHEVEKWGFLTLDDVPEEISVVARVRLLLENGAPLGPDGDTTETYATPSRRGPLNNSHEVEAEETGQAEGAEDGSRPDVGGQEEAEAAERHEQDENEGSWESDSTDSSNTDFFYEFDQEAHTSAMALALKLAASDKKASFRPEVGFKLNDVFLDIFCEYATKDNITNQYLHSLIREYTQPRGSETESEFESSGRLAAARGKLDQLRQRLYS